MNIIVIGIKGFPNICGGVDIHSEELYPRLVKLGCNVTVIARKHYFSKKDRLEHYNGVRLHYLHAPKNKKFEVIIHTLLGILYARLKSPDILHVHWLGPAFLIPLAKLFGLRTIVTHHGQDHKRLKYGKLAKLIFKLGEVFSVKYADKVIVVSDFIGGILEKTYNYNNYHVIYNGSNIHPPSPETHYINSLGISSKKYILGVGRFAKEKGYHDLIDAFKLLNEQDTKLVLVGDEYQDTNYSKELKQKAISNGVILTGYLNRNLLHQVFSHAKIFVMPSYLEGLPITLLEAMSYNLPVLVSDIPPHLDIGLSPSHYYRTGDINDLYIKLKKTISDHIPVDYSEIINHKYNWDVIADKTYLIYKQLCEESVI